MRATNRIWNRVTDFAINYLSQGITPRQLALAVTVGLVLGVFPMLGTTTLLCFFAGTLLRLNQPILQTVNYLASPLQYILLLPFIRLGGMIFGAPSLQLSLTQVQVMLRTNLWEAIQRLFDATLYGIAAWAITALPSAVISMLLLSMLFRRIKLKKFQNGSPARDDEMRP